MSGASIETTLELWASSLRDVKARIRPLFRQQRVAASAGLFLDGLLGEERRKTGWMRIPRDRGHEFHGKVGADSTRRWARIPRDHGRPLN